MYLSQVRCVITLTVFFDEIRFYLRAVLANNVLYSRAIDHLPDQ
jgi:hypothetical protein